MALKIGNTEVTDVIYNGVALTKILVKKGTAAAVTVWEKAQHEVVALIEAMTSANSSGASTYALTTYDTSSTPAWKSFDGSTSTRYMSSSNSDMSKHKLVYRFKFPVSLDHLEYTPNGSATSAKNFYSTTVHFAFYSNATLLETVNVTVPGTSLANQLNKINVKPSKTLTDVTSFELTWDGRTQNGASNTSAYYCTSGEIQAYGWQQNDHSGESALIPKLTSNTSSGTASCYSQLDTSSTAWKAFDQSATSTYCSKNIASTAVSNEYLKYVWTGTKTVNVKSMFVQVVRIEETSGMYNTNLTVYFYDVNGSLIKSVSDVAFHLTDTNLYKIGMYMELDEIKNVHSVKMCWDNPTKNASSSTSNRYVTCSQWQLYGTSN